MLRLSLYLIVALAVVSLFNANAEASRYGGGAPLPFGGAQQMAFRRLQNEIPRTGLKIEKSKDVELYSNVLSQIKEAGGKNVNGNLKPSQIKNDQHLKNLLARAKQIVARLLALYKEQ